MSWTLGKVCKTLNLEYQGAEDLPLHRVSGLENLVPGAVAFIDKVGFLDDLNASPECVLVVPEKTSYTKCPLIFSPHPLSDHVKIAQLLHPGAKASGEIHPNAVIGSKVQIGEGVTIDANVVIGDDISIGANTVIRPGAVIMEGTEIGENCLIYPNVSIREYSSIGSRVILHNNVSIGADGYGFYFKEGKHHKIPQVGTVRIEDDVEIGASSSIDRARFSVTKIGQGTKIDNQVQVAHNVQIGKNCLLVGGVGIAGSTVIGDYCILAGQVGVTEHLTLGNQVTVLAKSLVTESFPDDNQILAGIPARPAKLWKRMFLRTRQLDSLFERVKTLEKQK